MRRLILATILAVMLALPPLASGATAVVNPDGSASGPFGTDANAQRLALCAGLRPGGAAYARLRCDWEP